MIRKDHFVYCIILVLFKLLDWILLHMCHFILLYGTGQCMLPLFCAEVLPCWLVQMRWQRQRNGLLAAMINIWNTSSWMIWPGLKKVVKITKLLKYIFLLEHKPPTVSTVLEIMLNDIALLRLIYIIVNHHEKKVIFLESQDSKRSCSGLKLRIRDEEWCISVSKLMNKFFLHFLARKSYLLGVPFIIFNNGTAGLWDFYYYHYWCGL